MCKSFLVFSCAIVFAIPQATSAEGLFDKIDRMITNVESSVDRTERTFNRAEGTATRLYDKIPEAGAGENTSKSSGLSAEEQQIMERAQQIEDERTLREAEKIRQRMNQSSAR